MALFRRKKDNDVLPEEVQDYYRAEERDRTGRAWLFAAGGFVLTVAVVLGLFFAGRWAYQAVFNDRDNGTITDVDDANDNDNDEEAPVDENDEQLPDFFNDEDDAEEANDEDEAEPSEPETPRTGPELPQAGPSSEE